MDNMNATNYEALCGEEQIYNGTSKDQMILELTEYIECQNHIDETQITEAEIKSLNKKALKNIGIEIFFAKW